MILLSAACGEVLQPTLEPDAAIDPDAAGADATTCDPSVRQLAFRKITTTATTCCGSSLDALGDGSGLAGDRHDCNDATMWKSAQTSGEITIDLGAEHELTGLKIWNSAQLNGARGARNVQIVHSRDNKSIFQLPGAPSVLARATTCPSDIQAFGIPNVRTRFVHVQLSDSYGATNVGLGEIALIGRSICE